MIVGLDPVGSTSAIVKRIVDLKMKRYEKVFEAIGSHARGHGK
jgi:hypothetical protein